MLRFFTSTPDSNRFSGFTLVELSVVMVIIGLLIGGIMVGREMIKSSQVRSTVSQIESLKAAVNAFNNKYDGLPGDLTAASAATFGMVTRAGTIGQGDGNQIIIAGGGGYGEVVACLCGEPAMFWNDLSVAQLIAGKYNGTDGNSSTATCPAGSKSATYYMPSIPLGTNSVIMVYTDGADSQTYFHVVSFDYPIQSNNGDYIWSTTSFNSLSTSQASSIDAKIDDGMPLSGTVQAVSQPPTYYGYPNTAVPITPAAPGTGVCVSNGTGNPYNTSIDTDKRNCNLRFQL